MPDQISTEELALVAKVKALQGVDAKPLFDFADSYNGILEGKENAELKGELERRGVHSAFVFSVGGTVSKIWKRGQPRRKLPEFVVLVGAVNLQGDASTRLGSPGSAGVYELLCAVIDAVDGKPLTAESPAIYAREFSLLVSTQEIALAAVVFDHQPPGPHERP